jgi:putative DNA primase/helicase
VSKALRSEVIIPSVQGSPSWIEGEAIWAPEEVLPAMNGLFHIPSLAAGNPNSLPSTPRFFSPFALDYEINTMARPPQRWLSFLNQLWPNDSESISTLQEWMGYLLTPDTRQQKILMLIGPPRSGKSTIGRIMTAMIGKSNVAGPTLSSFRGEFGLQPLLDKSLAIISDARLRGPADIVTERLLSISGEDRLTVNRKGIPAINAKLVTRLVLIGNEIPRFDDSSGALPHRMILLSLRNDFRGREDTTLTEQLLLERSGILMWGVEGWKRLRERGHFLQPSSSLELIEDLNDLSSPVGAFVKECCEVGAPSRKVPRLELYQAYLQWCQENGFHFPDRANTFGRNLRAFVPGLGTTQPRMDGDKVRFYTGISLKK